MKEPREPLFLARGSYRRRRLMDAARILPVTAVILFLVPVLWPRSTLTSGGWVYLFAIWLLLIVGALLLGRKLQQSGDAEDSEQEPRRDRGSW